MDEAYNRTLEMPSSYTKLPEQLCSKTHHNNKTNKTDTSPQIPSIEIREQSQITLIDPHKTCSIRKPPIPKIIITPPDDTSTTKKIVKVMKKMRYI